MKLPSSAGTLLKRPLEAQAVTLFRRYDTPLESKAAEKIKSWTTNPIPYLVVASVLGLILFLALATICFQIYRRKRKASMYEVEYAERLAGIKERLLAGKLKPVTLLSKRSSVLSKRSSVLTLDTKDPEMAVALPQAPLPVICRTSPTLPDPPGMPEEGLISSRRERLRNLREAESKACNTMQE